MPLVIGAKYSPYSFDELLKPLAMAQQEYNTVQEGLSTLTDSSNQFSRYLEGTQAGERVKAYNAAIDAAATDMAKNGLKRTNRDTLLGLKRQYNNEIAKINQSAAQLDTLYKGVQAAQLKAQASGDTLFVANMPNVDDLMANPSATPTMISGMGLQKQGMQAAQSASLRNVFNSTRAGQGVMHMYNEIIQGYGYNSAQAQKFLQDASTIPELQQAIESISTMYGINSLGNDSARAKQFIMQGIMDGLTAQQKSTFMQDPEKTAQLELNNAIQKAMLSGKGTGAGGGDSRMSIGRLNSPDINESKEKYKKYFTEDGRLTTEGLRQYKGYDTEIEITGLSAPTHAGSYTKHVQDKDFVDFVNNKLGIKDGKNFVSRVNSAWQSFTSPTGEGFGDTSSIRTFDMKLRDTASKALKTQLSAAYGGDAEVPVVTDVEVGKNGARGRWKTSGTVDMEDLMDDDYTIAKVQASPHTGSMIALFVNKKGEKNVAIEVPTSVIAGLNSSQMYNNALTRMQQLEQMSTNNPALVNTPAYKQAMNEVRQMIEQSMLNHLQHFDQESTKDAE